MGLSFLTRVILEPIAFVYRWSPRFVQRALGRSLGWLLRVGGYRRRVVEFNLRQALGDASPSRVAFAYRSFGELTCELLLLLGGLKRFTQKYVRLRGFENWDRAHREGRGVIFLSSHVGNWEFMSAGGAQSGMDLMIVTKHLKPEWLHKRIEKVRKHAGYLGTYEPRTLREGYGHLRSGKTLGFVLDQYAGPPVGIRVPFLGLPVGTPAVVAVLAKRSGAAVVPVVNYRTPEGTHEIRIEPPLEWIVDENPDREIARNTAAYARRVEQHVREFPEQWLWVHRRFKGDLTPLLENEWTQPRPRTGPPRDKLAQLPNNP